MIIDNDTLAAQLKARYDAREKDVDKLIEMSHALTRKVADAIPMKQPRYKVGQSINTQATTWANRKWVPYEKAVVTDVFEHNGQIAYSLSITYGEPAKKVYTEWGNANMYRPVDNNQWVYESDIR